MTPRLPVRRSAAKPQVRGATRPRPNRPTPNSGRSTMTRVFYVATGGMYLPFLSTFPISPHKPYNVWGTMEVSPAGARPQLDHSQQTRKGRRYTVGGRHQCSFDPVVKEGRGRCGDRCTSSLGIAHMAPPLTCELAHAAEISRFRPALQELAGIRLAIVKLPSWHPLLPEVSRYRTRLATRSHPVSCNQLASFLSPPLPYPI